MTHVYVGLGSNIGDRIRFLSRALGAMARIPNSRLLRWSRVYETEPVGKKEQPLFLNMVAELETAQTSAGLLALLKEIERHVGRTTSERWGPREIDLDILYYGSEILNDADLKIPHPEVANRRFVLVPMKELASDLVDPLRQQTIQELCRVCQDNNAVRTTPMTVHPTE